MQRPDSAEDALLKELLEAVARVAQHLQRGVPTARDEPLAAGAPDAHQRRAHRRSQDRLGEEHRRAVGRVPGVRVCTSRSAQRGRRRARATLVRRALLHCGTALAAPTHSLSAPASRRAPALAPTAAGRQSPLVRPAAPPGLGAAL